MSGFVHLHTHSMYSLRDSIIRPDDLVARLKEIDQDTVAITDHGGSLGGVTLYNVLKKAGIRYIHGVEFYICDNLTVKDKNNRYYHLVALCKNDTGRLNMNRLITKSEHPNNKYYRPRIDFELLKQYSDGLLIMSACMAGEISVKFLQGNDAGAESIAKKYRDFFGDDYYLEIQAHNDPVQIELNQKIVALAKKLNIPFVVTCDAHYTWESDRKYQNKYAFNGAYKENGESYLDCFVQSKEEVRQRLSCLSPEDREAAIAETHRIADKCHVEMPISAPIMPKIDTPPEFSSNEAWLHHLCVEGFRQKLNIDFATGQTAYRSASFQPGPEQIRTYLERYRYEFNALRKMGFIDYILLVHSYSNIGKRRGIARGSGGGSLVNYLTNITNIDPIEHGLYFERFIDVSALDRLEAGVITAKELKIPDIDLDFSGESCKEVLQFLYNTYGEDRVASIGRFGTNKTKGTIRDMAKVLDIDLATADEIAKSFEAYEIEEIDAMLHGELEMSDKAEAAIRYVRACPKLFEYVRKLNGLPKSFGLHPCGRVISTRDLDEFLPSCYDANGIRFLQGDMHDVEDVGLVKVDILGLRTLDQEYDTLAQSGESEEFISPKQNFHDDKVLDIFRKGDTLGIFQMSSFGMRSTLKKMNVSGIEDLSVANALFRPGAIAYIDNYCRRKTGQEKFTYLHPDLEPILKNTYGIIVFQEQLIEIGRIAGMRNPDDLRKATGKKNPELLAKCKPELFQNLQARGWNGEQLERLWLDMLDFARYSFNKSHSSAYSIIAYMTAKQKAYYPAEFYAGLCNSFIGHSAFVKENAEEIVGDAAEHGVYVDTFNFRNDHRTCSVRNGKILWAIPLIRDCNSQTANILYKNRNIEIKYFWRLARHLLNDGMAPSALQILVKLGFFREFGMTNTLLRILDMADLFKFGERMAIKKEKLENSEFLRDTVLQNGTDRGKNGTVLNSVRLLDCPAILDACEEYMQRMSNGDMPYKITAAYQIKMLGFLHIDTVKEEDLTRFYVKDVSPMKRKKDRKIFGYNIRYQSIGSGKLCNMTVMKSRFDRNPIAAGDIILCKSWERNGQYFRLLDYEHIFI